MPKEYGRWWAWRKIKKNERGSDGLRRMMVVTLCRMVRGGLSGKRVSHTIIQRSPNSPSWLKMRDPYPDWPGKIPVVPVASQEEARSTRKVRGTPGSFHHSKSPPDVSVLSRGTCLPFTASTFTGRTDSHDGGTWDSPVGKPRGKASWESLEGKQETP